MRAGAHEAVESWTPMMESSTFLLFRSEIDETKCEFHTRNQRASFYYQCTKTTLATSKIRSRFHIICPTTDHQHPSRLEQSENVRNNHQPSLS